MTGLEHGGPGVGLAIECLVDDNGGGVDPRLGLEVLQADKRILRNLTVKRELNAGNAQT